MELHDVTRTLTHKEVLSVSAHRQCYSYFWIFFGFWICLWSVDQIVRVKAFRQHSPCGGVRAMVRCVVSTCRQTRHKVQNSATEIMENNGKQEAKFFHFPFTAGKLTDQPAAKRAPLSGNSLSERQRAPGARAREQRSRGAGEGAIISSGFVGTSFFFLRQPSVKQRSSQREVALWKPPPKSSGKHARMRKKKRKKVPTANTRNNIQNKRIETEARRRIA